MTTVIDYLSPKAKEVIASLGAHNLGVLSAHLESDTPSQNAIADANLFYRSARFGRYRIQEYDAVGNLLKTSLLLNGVEGNDYGNLVGFLRHQCIELGAQSFLYKHYKHSEFSEIFRPLSTTETPEIKYNYADRVIKLTSIKTFFSRTEQVW